MKTFLGSVILAVLCTAFSAHAQTCPTPAQFNTDITASTLGQVISMSGTLPLSCPEIVMSQTWGGGKLIFSDSPESPTVVGQLYKDTAMPATSGTAYHRVYNYHVNNSGSTKRFVVVLKNTSGSSATLTVQQTGLAGPSTSFAYAGKLAVQRWIDSTAASGVSVAAGATVNLDATYNTTNVATGNLYHGIWDYSFPATHEIHICMLNTTDSATAVCPGKAVLARDTHQRGTFDYTEKTYDSGSGVTVDVNAGIQQFPLAGNTTNDTNVAGFDNAVAVPTAESISGNYGVLYRIHIATADNDATLNNIGFCVNPRGGSWSGAARVEAGVLPTVNTTTLLPAGSGSTSDNTKCTVEGRYSPGSAFTVWQLTMPSGGASLPIRVLAVPH